MGEHQEKPALVPYVRQHDPTNVHKGKAERRRLKALRARIRRNQRTSGTRKSS